MQTEPVDGWQIAHQGPDCYEEEANKERQGLNQQLWLHLQREGRIYRWLKEVKVLTMPDHAIRDIREYLHSYISKYSDI